MNKYFNKIKSIDGIGIILLAIFTVLAGYMVYFQKDFKVSTSTKSESTNKNLSGYNFNDYYDDYYDDEYDNYYDNYYDDYNYNNYDEYDADDYYNDYYDNYNNYYDDDYYNDYYNDNYYNDSYRYTSSNYNSQYNYYNYGDTEAPAIKWSKSKILNQYSTYYPMDDVSASHSKFGDVSDLIEVIYNDVDTSVPGIYTTVYKACNYPGSIYCRAVSRSVTVKENNYQVGDRYSKGPIWSNNDSKSCSQGSSSCNTYNITKPTAKDPVTNRELTVRLTEGYVDVNTPGIYTLIYSAETRSGVKGTVSKIVTIKENYSSGYSSYNRQQSKYISNYYSSYYDDGNYRGYLESDYSNQQNSKYITNYEWTNKVTYTYQCINQGEYGLSGWSLMSTDKSNGQYASNADNHPTYYYNKGGYTGNLEKVNFYSKDSDDKYINDLGYCNTVGQTKQISRNWVGVYSGYVYSNYGSNYNSGSTYSGYVYLYK